MPVPATSLRDTVETTLPKIFDQAQSSIANHQKNCVALYKLHLTASELRQSSSSGNGEKLVGERFFEETICDMMSRVMLVKKGQGVADRIAKFLGAYIKVLVEKSKLLLNYAPTPTNRVDQQQTRRGEEKAGTTMKIPLQTASWGECSAISSKLS